MSDCSPCYAWCLSWGNGRESLVAAQEGKEVEVVVCGVGAACEVGGGGGDDAGVLWVGWWEGGEVYWGCRDGEFGGGGCEGSSKGETAKASRAMGREPVCSSPGEL